MDKEFEDLFKNVLGRDPIVPWPQGYRSVGKWKDFVRNLELRDPEAFETFRTVLKCGVSILDAAPEGTEGEN